VASRFIALFVLLSAGFAAPGAALAHGVAHHREHDERDHNALSVADHSDGPGVSGEHDGRDHQHPRVDGAVRGRTDALSFILVPAPAAAVVQELLVPGSFSLPGRTASTRAQDSTGPPPRLRSPPLH
jgi:hypothetical protein